MRGEVPFLVSGDSTELGVSSPPPPVCPKDFLLPELRIYIYIDSSYNRLKMVDDLQ